MKSFRLILPKRKHRLAMLIAFLYFFLPFFGGLFATLANPSFALRIVPESQLRPLVEAYKVRVFSGRPRRGDRPPLRPGRRRRTAEGAARAAAAAAAAQADKRRRTQRGRPGGRLLPFCPGECLCSEDVISLETKTRRIESNTYRIVS